MFQVKFYFQYPVEEISEKPVIKSSQTTPSFNTNGNQNNNISKATMSMDSLRVDSVAQPPNLNSQVGHSARSQQHLKPQTLQQQQGVSVRHLSGGSRHNRPVKVSPSGDRRGLVVPKSSGSGDQISDSLSTGSDEEDFSDTESDDEWEGCDVTEV